MIKRKEPIVPGAAATPKRKRRFWQRLRDLVLHRYLRKMLLATLLLAMLPCCLAFWSFLHYSMEELKTTNEEYYQQNAKIFSDAFVEKLSLINRHAAQISTDTRDSVRSAFQMQRDALLESPVNYYTIFLKQLAQYDWSICDEWGVYYQTYDILFCSNAKYTLDSYLSTRQNEEGDAFLPSMTSFFQSNSWGVHLCPKYDEYSSSLYVGIPARMGTANDPAMFFYRLDAKTIGLSFISPLQDTDAQFILFDKGMPRLLFMTGQSHLSPAQLMQVYQSKQPTTSIGGVEYSLFINSEASYQWDSAVVFPTARANANEIHFFRNMQLLLFVVTILLLMMLSMLVHINYRPMQQTLTTLGLNAYDEWESLRGTYAHMQWELLEHNQRILDLLLKNLLYNVPISSANAARLGLLAQGNSYLVCVMNGTLDSQKRTALMDALYGQLEIIASITDILALDLTVIICRAEHVIDQEMLRKWSVDYFKAHLPKYQQPSVGIVVDNISLIHTSYTSCFVSTASSQIHDQISVQMPDPEDKKYGPRLTALKEQVVEHLQQNLSDNTLSQTSVADHFGVSVYSLSRLFKNQIASGFTEYINTLRLEAACELLVQTEQSITEISEQVGFSNISYFSRLFKQVYAVSPTQYRKDHAPHAGT